VSQDLKTLDINKLNPLSPEVISRQATINIGEQLSMLLGQVFFCMDVWWQFMDSWSCARAGVHVSARARTHAHTFATRKHRHTHPA